MLRGREIDPLWDTAFHNPGSRGETFVPGGLLRCADFWREMILKAHAERPIDADGIDYGRDYRVRFSDLICEGTIQTTAVCA